MRVENRVFPVGPNRFPIEGILDDDTRGQLIKDGYGYCIERAILSFVRVEIIPDSEFYYVVKPVPNEEARAWYESFGKLEDYFAVLRHNRMRP